MAKNKNRTWDSQGSAYKQIIKFVNGKSLVGYSGTIEFKEGQNKLNVLKGFILRMALKGYLDKKNPKKDDIEYIEYWEMSSSNHVFNLYYTYEEYVDETILTSDYYRPIVDFLAAFYAMVRKGLPMYEIFAELYPKQREKRADLLDTSKRRFNSLPALKHFCLDLIARKIEPKGAVEQFFINYGQRHFHRTPELDLLYQ